MLFQLIQPVYAQCTPGSDSGINLGNCLLLDENGTTVDARYNTFSDIINLIVGNAFVLAGVILFLLIFYAGFKFVSGGSKAKDEARTMITTALVGFIIMFVAYWVVQLVELITGTQILL